MQYKLLTDNYKLDSLTLISIIDSSDEAEILYQNSMDSFWDQEFDTLIKGGSNLKVYQDSEEEKSVQLNNTELDIEELKLKFLNTRETQQFIPSSGDQDWLGMVILVL